MDGGNVTVALAVNCGSSSLKYALFDGAARLAAGTVEGIGVPGGHETHAHAVQEAFEALARFPAPQVVGHRFVHGGPEHHAPALLDDALLKSLHALRRFAPLHLPSALAAAEAVRARAPALPQVACFDTDFHWSMPEVARRLPVPEALDAAGVRRYGFHGLSYESVVDAVGAAPLGRAVIAHLGNGSSMCAVQDGKSVDTTMGLTPAGGLMMGTRTGDVDPGVLLFLLENLGYTGERVGRLVNRESGLLGVSALTSDMRTLLASEEPRAKLAVAMFCRQASKFIGALAAVLGGVDTLVFTGGIGEHAAAVRAAICAPLAHLGVRLSETRNARNEGLISEAGAGCEVRIVAAREEEMIARHALRVGSR